MKTNQEVKYYYYREECQGFVGIEVTYIITAAVAPGTPASWHDHGSGDEIEFLKVIRMDPDTEDPTEISLARCPFTDAEWRSLQAIFEESADRSPPERDDPPEPDWDDKLYD